MPRAVTVLLPYALTSEGARQYLGMTKAVFNGHLRAGRIPPASSENTWRRVDLEEAYEALVASDTESSDALANLLAAS